jgi:hypothetical protein
MAAGAQAQIQTEHFRNASLEHCCYTNSLEHICSSQGNKSREIEKAAQQLPDS